MITECIIYTNLEGSICVVIPTGELPIDEVLAKDIPEGATGISVIDVSEVPTDRTFRSAWEHDTSPAPRKIAVNLARAKEIAHDKRRAKRAVEFSPLDVEVTIPTKVAEAEAKRQNIRDKHAVIQCDIDACTTPEQLKAVIVAASL